MAYTPHTWTTGETITAAKMNNLEEGCQSAGSGGVVVALCWQDDEGVWHIDGNFADAYAKITASIPFVAVRVGSRNIQSTFVSFDQFAFCNVLYETEDPNAITIYFSSSDGLYWTANSVSYFD